MIHNSSAVKFQNFKIWRAEMLRRLSRFILLAAFGTSCIISTGWADEVLTIVGSSTVYPFARQVVDTLDQQNNRVVAKVTATGSGGGFQLFCGQRDPEKADITNASRRMKKSEYEMCQENGITKIVEIKIGYDGIVLAHAKRPEAMPLTRRDIFLALSAKVPNPDGTETFVSNPYKNWKQINSALPDQPIKVYGPPPTSGTRDAFEELAMEGGCAQFQWITQLKKKNKMLYQQISHEIRQDGPYVDAGEDDSLIVKRISGDQEALGIFGFSYLVRNSELLDGSRFDGIAPTLASINDGTYPLSRPLFIYVNVAHMNHEPDIAKYLDEFTNEKTWGPKGYLSTKGFISLSDEDRQRNRKIVKELSLMPAL